MSNDKTLATVVTDLEVKSALAMNELPPNGERIEKMRKALEQFATGRAVALPAAPKTAKFWCDCCDGVGTIDQRLGGLSFSDPMATCPDCDGNGYFVGNLLAASPAPSHNVNLVPGKVRCAKCSFVLLRRNLNVNVGTITAGDSKTEPCPNGCGPLWPITWEQEARQGWEDSERLLDRAHAAETALAELKARLGPIGIPADDQKWRN